MRNLTQFEEFDNEHLTHIEAFVESFAETSHLDRKFLNGAIRMTKPKKLLEIGVSAGGSSLVMLNAIEDIAGAKLWSVDISKEWYRDRSKSTGFMAKSICSSCLMGK